MYTASNIYHFAFLGLFIHQFPNRGDHASAEILHADVIMVELRITTADKSAISRRKIVGQLQTSTESLETYVYYIVMFVL